MHSAAKLKKIDSLEIDKFKFGARISNPNRNTLSIETNWQNSAGKHKSKTDQTTAMNRISISLSLPKTKRNVSHKCGDHPIDIPKLLHNSANRI